MPPILRLLPILFLLSGSPGQALCQPLAQGWEVSPGGRAYAYARDRAWALGPDGRALESERFAGLGDIASLDATDPFKLALFFGQTSRLLLLDPRWRPLGPALELDGLHRSPNALACLSARGGFWLFDPFDASLCRYDDRLRPAARFHLPLPPGERVERMDEQRGQVVLRGSSAAWAVRPDGSLARLVERPPGALADWNQGQAALLEGQALSAPPAHDSLPLDGPPPLALRLRNGAAYLFWTDSMAVIPLVFPSENH